MGHIHLHVADMERDLAFYTEGLGLDVVSRIGRHASFLSSGSYHHHVALNTWNGVGAPAPAAASAGLQEYTLCYPDQAALKEAAARLQQQGASVTMQEDSVLTTDFSGNPIRMTTAE
ncbi:VOC family protein, partial [Alkalicoccus chagannorensis]|uniref:VOC family protein n=1 Tax=Alkalicoccus chagannorensis TaxID=427072 RepID=UPI0003F92639